MLMTHLPMLPILIPMLGGLLMLLPPFAGLARYQNRRYFAFVLVALQLMCGMVMLDAVIVDPNLMYAVGNWQPPFGIILYVDPLAALMVCLTSFLGFAVVLYSFAGEDRAGRYYHPLIQFQILGINGAFLTNDLFNLFVFFEVLLIASYSLLIHAGAKQKTEAAVHYVILNLIGSSIFLFALGTMYGAVGSLNVADIAQKISSLSESQLLLTNISGALLLVVFGLKSAMLPLHFWLPKTYAAASAPIAALFAIMTKVGIYCIFRVYTTVYGDFAGGLSHFVTPIIWPLAIASIVVGSVGVIVNPTLRGLAGNLVIVSVGTLLLGFALRTPEASAAAFFYMIHSTIASAILFLLAEMIGQQRGKAQDRFVISRKLKNQRFLGFCFFIAAMMAAGLPPFSGFLGKLVILQSAVTLDEKIWVYSALLISSLITIIAFSRAGTTIFWRHAGNKDVSDSPDVTLWQKMGLLVLLVAGPALALGGQHMLALTDIAALELHNVSGLIELMGVGGLK